MDMNAVLRSFVACVTLPLVIFSGTVAAAAEPPASAAPTSQPAMDASGGKPLKAGQPFTDKAPSSLVSFTMLPVPGKKIWMEQTELPWDVFDAWQFSMDLTEDQKAKGVDAKSRPSKPYAPPDRGFGHAGYPNLSSTYKSAEFFCKWLSKQTGHKYRLPTAQEYEFACKAGGDGKVADLKKVAWYWDNSEDKTHPCAQKAPNSWGFYDLLGNAGEWATDTDGPVLCGGTYDDKAEDVHCSAKKKQTEDWNSTDPQDPKSSWWLSDGTFVSFRIVCEP
jgi:hypothetical protein